MIDVSGQAAKTSPPFRRSPSFTFRVTGHFFSTSRAGMSLPSGINAPDVFAISLSGRSMPSKMFERMPGPRVAQSGPPVPVTGSPGRMPVVPS